MNGGATAPKSITSEMLLNGINSAMKSMNKGPAAVSAPTPIRPKALSIGSFSLGSSGDLSPPSSQSGSPTSLNSFFNEDAFIGFSPFHAPSVNGNASANATNATAFSFSPDFASLLCAPANVTMPASKPLLPSDLTLADSYQNGVAIRSSLMAINGGRSDESQSSAQSDSGKSCASSGIGSVSPPPALYPAAPSSPVDSLDSELEMLNLGSKPVASSSSGSSTGSSPPPSSGLPRLPIFTRFANNGNNSD